jgi:hypothetical protein
MNWSSLDAHHPPPSLVTSEMFTMADYADHYHIPLRTAYNKVAADLQMGVIQKATKVGRTYYYQPTQPTQPTKSPKETHANTKRSRPPR